MLSQDSEYGRPLEAGDLTVVSLLLIMNQMYLSKYY
jgi:hypothetical protein